MAAFLTPAASEVEREGAREYLFDMIQQLAHVARRSGEVAVAIHLEAILAARLQEATGRSSARPVAKLV